MNTLRRTVIGVFEDRTNAQAAMNELRRAGFREDQLGVAARDIDVATARTVTDTDTGAAEGAAAGAVAGAALGGLWGLGVLAGVLPAIGPVIAGGTLAALAASAATGAAVAGVAGALIGLGVPEEEVPYYEEEFKSGRTVVTVQADGRFDEAWSILTRHGAYNRESGRPATAGHRAVDVAVNPADLAARERSTRRT
jgi:hypothetical protein